MAVFDYLKNNLGYLGYGNVTFYLVPTGRVQTEAAANSGLSSDAIASMEEGVAIIRDVQAKIALERDDVQLAPDYSDLNMVYEEGQIYGESYDRDYSSWSRDFWHLGHDGLKVNGSRLAQYIALDRGENNVISFTDSFGNPAQSVSISRAGLLDLNLSESSQGLIQGTDNPDAIAGTLANDEITGGNGNDVIVASQGVDTLTGGAGSDVFFYDALVYPDLVAHQDRILDFAVGSDRLDISELLSLSGYDGFDPIADGYIAIDIFNENNLAIQFDGDGRGEQPGNTIAILENVDLTSFQTEINDRFIFTPTEF
ncbi:MAG: type I secretion C-terminal target domain-containing protein [Pleurocapsa sp. MO_226.B13]|nr:type I secretion C-terminal target domain-containing protein [Pleurocapsa sp. MO_226.B13]